MSANIKFRADKKFRTFNAEKSNIPTSARVIIADLLKIIFLFELTSLLNKLKSIERTEKTAKDNVKKNPKSSIVVDSNGFILKNITNKIPNDISAIDVRLKYHVLIVPSLKIKFWKKSCTHNMLDLL